MPRRVSVHDVMMEADIDMVWDYLEMKFGYGKGWRKVCKEFVYERQRHISYKPDPIGDFLFFCVREVDPLLNAALCRRHDHPTFMRMMNWMFRDRIEMRG